MSFDALKRINMLRAFHQSREGGSSSETVRELKHIKGELKIMTDENARVAEPITNATNSPYLTDQSYHDRSVIFGSEKETEWKEVKTAEQLRQSVLKKLNII